MSISRDNVKKILDIVGREGTIAALEKSKKLTSKDLSELSRSLGLKSRSRDAKKILASKIVQNIDKRITKALDELKKMSKDELMKYFEEIGCHQDELLELLNDIDLKARSKSRRAIIEFAAIQINSLGIFERLSEPNDKKLSYNISRVAESIA
ncbi:putative Rho termination factor N-terminal domain-containing protein [Candidatus Magnetomoraceae bacterium gMMP-15]